MTMLRKFMRALPMTDKIARKKYRVRISEFILVCRSDRGALKPVIPEKEMQAVQKIFGGSYE